MAEPVSDQPSRPDTARDRPPDPAGTRPKVDPGSLLPENPAPLLVDADAEAVEIDELGREIGANGHEGAAAAPVVMAAAVAPAQAEPSTALILPDTSGGLERPVAAQSPHAPRFQFILGALIALGLSAAVLVVGVFHAGRDPLPTPWSTWHPTTGGYTGAAQIATRIGDQYRLADGKRLVSLTGGPPASLQGVPATVAVKTTSAATGVVALNGAASVLYTMCGTPPSCQITDGKPSIERLMLIRREALELALYTFHYLGADDVVVELPPVFTRVRSATGQLKTVTQRTAAFFTATELSKQTSQPLRATLTPRTPDVATVSQSPDSTLVQQLTSPSFFFKFRFISNTQDGNLYLVLQPPTVT